MASKLNLDPASVLLARELARRSGEPVTRLARTHTTVSVERAVLRLGGLDGADGDGTPWVNRLTDAVRESVGLEHGVALPVWDALGVGGYPDLRTLAEAASGGQARFRLPPAGAAEQARELAVGSLSGGLSDLDRQRDRRTRMTADLGEPPSPWAQLIVATGDLDRDVPLAQAAARDGADVIAVLRPAGPLLDYVPEQAASGFRRLRAALDQTSRELGRYVRLAGYASGLCMPEIALLGGLERLDLVLSDCLHQIIVRDVNPVRIFIDQRFARALAARAGLTVSPGEESYLDTAGPAAPAPAVVVSQLLNEYFGREAGLDRWQLGIGHAFAIDPAEPDSFLLELAQAQLIRELFPGAPLKYMPPATTGTGTGVGGCLLDAFFTLAGLMTDQSTLLVGAVTGRADGPGRGDADVALANVRSVRAAAGRLGLSFAPDSFVIDRAQQVLDEAVGLLRRISTDGLLHAVAEGTFGAARRPPDGGQGLDGVVPRAELYFNPATSLLEGTDSGAQGDPMAELI